MIDFSKIKSPTIEAMMEKSVLDWTVPERLFIAQEFEKLQRRVNELEHNLAMYTNNEQPE